MCWQILAEETLRWYQKSVKSKRQASAAPSGQQGGAVPSSGAPAKRVRDSTQARPGTKRRVTGHPIIIVPNSMTGVISSVNARDLLEAGQYVSLAEKKQQGGKRQPRFQIARGKENRKRDVEGKGGSG